MKKSIKQKDYDYSYYEEGPYGEKPRKKNFFDHIKDIFRWRDFFIPFWFYSTFLPVKKQVNP